MSVCTRHIVLIGFMGSGKTTIARKIARWHGLVSIDMDNYLERQQQMSIDKLFATYGEAYFRQIETDFLKSLSDRDRCVLSTGGGVVKLPENRALLKVAGTVVYLEVSANEALSRIGDVGSRPLLLSGISPQQLLCERQALYEEIADIVVDTSGLGIASVAQHVIAALQERGEL